jgi:hypothetical protein
MVRAITGLQHELLGSVTAFPRWSHHFFTNIIMRRDPDLEEKRDRWMTLTPKAGSDGDALMR